MYRRGNLYSSWLVSLCTVLAIGFIGCGDGDSEGDNELVGTWRLESVDGATIQQTIDQFKQLAAAFGQELEISYTEDWTFESDGMWRRESTLVAPNDAGEVETSSFEATGTYSLSGSSYSITIMGTTGADPTEDIQADIDFDFADIINGTWSIDGGTLTLTGAGGTTLGFERQ
ncbi:MAG: lipocalin family protein [Candidatus Poribacteria bacterium]|nr:lipocalin family protein [Candidatus Poribacteria bacterium]MDE0506748.1 lipocalin family protein [Candidatus Poribacteria bacterium]